jgi:hypothetical protein
VFVYDSVAGHPLLQTGSKVLCAFIQDPQWDRVWTLCFGLTVESMELSFRVAFGVAFTSI